MVLLGFVKVTLTKPFPPLREVSLPFSHFFSGLTRIFDLCKFLEGKFLVLFT